MGPLTCWWMGGCPGLFPTTFGKQVNSPFWTSLESVGHPKDSAVLHSAVLSLAHDSAVQWHPKASYMRTWQSPYQFIGDGSDVAGHWYKQLDRCILRELSAVFSLLVCCFVKSLKVLKVGHGQQERASESDDFCVMSMGELLP